MASPPAYLKVFFVIFDDLEDLSPAAAGVAGAFSILSFAELEAVGFIKLKILGVSPPPDLPFDFFPDSLLLLLWELLLE